MTAHIYSKVQSLHFLSIHPMPAKPIKGGTFMRVPGTRTCVAVSPDGKTLYSTQVEGGRRSHENLDHGRIKPTIDGLIKLGVLSATAVREHQELVKASDEKRQRKNDAEAILSDAQSLGLKLTKAQLRKIESALGGGAVARAKIADKLGAGALSAL